MMWADEPYVRIYRRDTVDLVAMGWEARACLWELLRHVDRSGTAELGKHGARGLAALLHMPVDVVERVLPILEADGCIRIADDRIFVPNYLAAQEAPKSDAARKREERERKRETSDAVTKGDAQSRNRDAESRDVQAVRTDRDSSHEMSLLPSVHCLPSLPSVHVPPAHAEDGQQRGDGDSREIPQWFLDAVAVVEAEVNGGLKLDQAAAWLRYSGHRASKGKAMSKSDAQQFLISVDVKEAREARERGRRGNGTIKQAADEDAPWRRDA